jgi:hypothetical protein
MDKVFVIHYSNFRVIADLQGPERCNRHFGYCANIGISFASDSDLWIHGLFPLENSI